MKWFNLSAISKEIGKIRWPRKEDLGKNSISVIIFTALFCLFFYLCLTAITAILKGIGVL